MDTTQPARQSNAPITAPHLSPSAGRIVDEKHDRGVDDPVGLPPLVANGITDVVPGDPPVPITVWRLAHDAMPTGQQSADGLTGRIAQLIVGLYTRVGDTVVSLGDDPAIAGAAGAGGCRYLPVASARRLADLDHVAGGVRLLILHWPPATPSQAHRSAPVMSEDAMTDLFTAVKILMAQDGYTIVVIPPVTAGTAEHLWRLVPAARQAGLGWVEQIVAVTATDTTAHTENDTDHAEGGPLATPGAPADHVTTRLAGDFFIHVHLHVFVIHGRRHG